MGYVHLCGFFFRYMRISETFSIVSLLLAIFGVHTLARLTSVSVSHITILSLFFFYIFWTISFKGKLDHYGFMIIFRVVDIAFLFFTAQHPLIFENILVRFNLLKCGPLLSAYDNARCKFKFKLFYFSLCVCLTTFRQLKNLSSCWKFFVKSVWTKRFKLNEYMQQQMSIFFFTKLRRKEEKGSLKFFFHSANKLTIRSHACLTLLSV